MMKRLISLGSALVVMALALIAGGDDTPTIKDVMDKLHKGAKSPLAQVKAALKSDSPDWKNVQNLTKDFVVFGAALGKNDPPRGDKAAFERIANGYLADAKVLDEAAKAEDKAKAQEALKKLTASCKTCHAAHKEQ